MGSEEMQQALDRIDSIVSQASQQETVDVTGRYQEELRQHGYSSIGDYLDKSGTSESINRTAYSAIKDYSDGEITGQQFAEAASANEEMTDLFRSLENIVFEPKSEAVEKESPEVEEEECFDEGSWLV